MSVIVSVIWSAFFELVMVENARIAVGISTLYNYFRFGRPYCYFRLSVVFAITFFELAMVENPRVQLETKKKIVVLLLKLVGAFLPPSATRVRKIEAQYEGKMQNNGMKTVKPMIKDAKPNK